MLRQWAFNRRIQGCRQLKPRSTVTWAQLCARWISKWGRSWSTTRHVAESTNQSRPNSDESAISSPGGYRGGQPAEKHCNNIETATSVSPSNILLENNSNVLTGYDSCRVNDFLVATQTAATYPNDGSCAVFLFFFPEAVMTFKLTYYRK